jgi:sarcosine oxidase subunit gamma
MTGADSFRVVCFRSVAGYVFGLLEAAAAPGGEVGFH